jgi:hypothetical protein
MELRFRGAGGEPKPMRTGGVIGSGLSAFGRAPG